MIKIQTIIVDDEKKSREGLAKMVNDIEHLTIKAVCKDGLEAIESIEQSPPELLLLDIQMPGINGFDVLKSISCKPFVIFITAYDQYALRAFEHHALDYLLKPFTDSRFRKSIDRACKIIKGNQLEASLEQIRRFADQITSHEDGPILSTQNFTKLPIRSNGKILLLDFNKISWIEAWDYYIKIHEEQVHVVKDSLKNILGSLPDYFIRIHKSSIINLNHLESLEPIGHSEMIATLKDGSEVKVSRNYKIELLDKFSD